MLRQTVGRIRDAKDRTLALSYVAAAYARLQDTEAVRRIASQVLKNLKSIPLDLERYEALANLAEALALTGDYDRALGLAQEIRVEKRVARVLSSIVETLTLSGNPQTALQVALGDAAEFTPTEISNWLAGGPYRSEPLAVLGRMLAEQDTAATILSQVIELAHGIPHGSFGRNMVLSSVACGLAQAGKIERVLVILAEIEGFGWQDECWSALVSAYVRMGEFERAIQAARQTQSNPARISALCEVAIGLAEADRKEEADSHVSGALMHLTNAAQPSLKDIQTVASAVERRVSAGSFWTNIWIWNAFAAARSRGRSVTLDHIAAFVPVLRALGIVRSTWEVIQDVEAMFEALGAVG
jgi:tetratricopeptide (TPR) repeat protein